MNSFAQLKQETQSRAAAHARSREGAEGQSPFSLIENRRGILAQRRLDAGLNQSSRVASQLQLQQSFDRSPRLAAQAQTLQMMRAGRLSPQPIRSLARPVLQAKWEDTDNQNVQVWDEPIDGVTWYTDEQGLMWYLITNPEQIKLGTLEAYRYWEGPEHKYSYEKWEEIEREARMPLHEPVPVYKQSAAASEAESFLETVDLPPFVKKTILQICKVKNEGARFAMGLAETWKEEYQKLEVRVAKLAEQRIGIKEKQKSAQASIIGPSDITTELNKEDFSVIRHIAGSLAAAFPPATSVYVALGNSPIPVIIELQQQYKDSAEAVLMPLGGLSSPPFDSPKSFREKVLTNKQQTTRLMNYLGHFLAPYKNDKRTIVIVDYASSGTSMVVAHELFSLYFGNPKRVRTYVYATEAKVTSEGYMDNYMQLAKTGAIETGGNDPAFVKYLQKNEDKLFKKVMNLTLYESVDAQKVIATDDYTELIRPTLAGYLRLMRMFDPTIISDEDLY